MSNQACPVCEHIKIADKSTCPDVECVLAYRLRAEESMGWIVKGRVVLCMLGIGQGPARYEGESLDEFKSRVERGLA